MEKLVNVAVARGIHRRGAVAQALALIAPDLRACVRPRVVIKPNLSSLRHPLASTHADTLSATLDAVLCAGGERITVAEGAVDASAGFARFGYPHQCWGRPVRFLDVNRDETGWESVELLGLDGFLGVARLSRTIAEASCLVSLTTARTHDTAIVALGLENLSSCLHFDERAMMRGHFGASRGASGPLAAILDRDDFFGTSLAHLRGWIRRARATWRCADFFALTPTELHFLRKVDTLNRNLVLLARRARPQISVVDGFVGMHGEGPRHGVPIALGTVIAGTDPVAVDAVAAAVMGFDPSRIGYLLDAQAAGLGTADLDAITIVGDPIAEVRRPFKPHSNHAIQQHSHRFRERARSGPHFLVPRARRAVVR